MIEDLLSGAKAEDLLAGVDVRLAVESELSESLRVISDAKASESEWRAAFGAFAALKVSLRLIDADCQDDKPCYCALIARVREDEREGRAGDMSGQREPYEAVVTRARIRAQMGADTGLRQQLEERRDEAQAFHGEIDDPWSCGEAAAYHKVLGLIDPADSDDRP